jgi:hypothetical protein
MQRKKSLIGSRSLLSGLILAATSMLAACASPSPRSYQLIGLPVVGEIIRVEPAEIWEGDVPMEGHIYWLRSRGPEQSLISFAGFGGCPGSNPVGQHYFVMLVHERHGFVVDEAIKKDLPSLVATSCTRIDPKESYFTRWQER